MKWRFRCTKGWIYIHCVVFTGMVFSEAALAAPQADDSSADAEGAGGEAKAGGKPDVEDASAADDGGEAADAARDSADETASADEAASAEGASPSEDEASETEAPSYKDEYGEDEDEFFSDEAEDEDEETPSELGAGFSYEIGGHIRGDVWAGKMPDLARPEIKAGFGELALKLTVHKGDWGDAVGEVRVWSGYEDGRLDTKLKLREAYVNAYIGPLSIRFGQQIIVWGRAIGLNPTNNLTPIDLTVRSPEQDDRRLGNLALLMTFNMSVIRLEGAWVPLYQPTRIPSNVAPDWLVFDEPTYPDADLGNGTAAARFHLLFPSVEMSASYLHGYGLFPGLSLSDFNISQRGPRHVTLSRTAWEQHVAGFDFAASVKNYFAVRGEIAYRYPVDYKNKIYAPNPDLYYVIGLDRKFRDVHLAVQYVGRYVFDWSEIPGEPDEGLMDELPIAGVDVAGDTMYTNDPTEDCYPDNCNPDLRALVIQNDITPTLALRNRLIHFQSEPVQHGVAARVMWTTLRDRLTLTAFGLLNVSTLEWLLYPQLSYKITDAMTVSVGGEIYQGPDNSLFAMVEDGLTAGYTELKISF